METEAKFKKQVNTIYRHHPELMLLQDNSGHWHWSFRCTESKEVEDSDIGFSSPLETLAHFARWMSDEADELLEKLQENQEDQNITID